jgi:RNA polymerase sigma-70 factor, ECF subfamily
VRGVAARAGETVEVDDLELDDAARAAALGDRTALARFVEGTQAEVHRLCAFLVSPQEAADLAQDTYLRAIGSLPGFRGEAPARLWLLSIARRTCADHLRTRYRRRGIEERIPAAPDRVPAADPALWALLGELDPDQRAAFVLTQLLGLSYAEAAAAADCPIGTIRSRVARARATLVVLLRTADDGAPASSPPPGNPRPGPDDRICDVHDLPPTPSAAGAGPGGDADDPGRRLR